MSGPSSHNPYKRVYESTGEDRFWRYKDRQPERHLSLPELSSEQEFDPDFPSDQEFEDFRKALDDYEIELRNRLIRTSSDISIRSNHSLPASLYSSSISMMTQEGVQTPGLPPVLTGKTGDVPSSWFRLFELWSNSKGLENDRKVTQVPLFLGGNALECYWSLTEAQRGDYEGLKAALIEKLSPPDLCRQKASELYDCLQKEDEDALSFASRLTSNFRLAYPDFGADERGGLLLDLFIRGLKPQLQYGFFVSSPGSFEGAVRAASRFEANVRNIPVGATGIGETSRKTATVHKVSSVQRQCEGGNGKQSRGEESMSATVLALTNRFAQSLRMMQEDQKYHTKELKKLCNSLTTREMANNCEEDRYEYEKECGDEYEGENDGHFGGGQGCSGSGGY